jgi:hypothetical protein
MDANNPQNEPLHVAEQHPVAVERKSDDITGTPNDPEFLEFQRQQFAIWKAKRDGVPVAAAPLVNDSGLLVHADGGHLVGIEQAPPALVGVHALSAEEAANAIRGEFVAESMPPEYHHQAKFLTAVARHLGVEESPANLTGIAKALEAKGIAFPDLEYPKMLYGRTGPDPMLGFESHYDPRHDHIGVVVNNEDDAKKLGSGWVEDPSELPAREEKPVAFDGPKTARADDKPAEDPLVWDPRNKVVRARDGSIDHDRTDAERVKRGLVTPWTPEIGGREAGQPAVA